MTASIEEKPRPTTPTVPRRGIVIEEVAALFAAVQFLTVVPLWRRPSTAEELGRSVGWFPLVGVLLGGVLAAVDWLLGLAFRPGVSAALVLICWVLCSGALHVDGFLDACDGLFGGHTPEARLRIMRDERAGAFAVVGGILLLLVKYAALCECSVRMQALLIAPVVGRWGMSFAVIAFPYGRPQGLGKAMKDHAGWPQAALACVVAAIAAGAFGGWRGLLSLLLTGVATWVGARLVMRRLPGLTGDIYGALCELLEVLVLLVFTAGGSHAA